MSDTLDRLFGDPGNEAEQTTLLPEGQRTAEQEQSLGVDIFGAPESEPTPTTHGPSGSDDASSSEDASPQEEGAGTPSSDSLDPIVVQAGEVKVTRGSAAGKTVAEVVAEDPQRCVKYLAGGKDEHLKAAIQTYLHATHPELMEEE